MHVCGIFRGLLYYVEIIALLQQMKKESISAFFSLPMQGQFARIFDELFAN